MDGRSDALAPAVADARHETPRITLPFGLVGTVRVTALPAAPVTVILRQSGVAAAIAVVVRARHDDVPRVGVEVIAVPVRIGVWTLRGVIGVGIAVA
jgi:hypothetical protein